MKIKEHFRFRKVTPQMKIEMEKLAKQGMVQDKIAEKLGVHQSTVSYHLNPENRRKKIEREKRRQRTEKCRRYNAKRRVSKRYRKWIREYMKERYHKDPEFRRKMIRANSGGTFRE